MSATATPQAQDRNRGRATPPNVLVLGVDTADIVTGAGGLICDSIRAGTTVNVRMERAGNDQALHILGVKSQVSAAGFDVGGEWPDVIVFAAALREHDRSMRRLLAEAARRRRSELMLWGGAWPEDLDAGAAVEHQLSTAAHAFKSYAAKSAGVDTAIPRVERFHHGHRSAGTTWPSLIGR
jgi:hypothetical protein